MDLCLQCMFWWTFFLCSHFSFWHHRHAATTLHRWTNPPTQGLICGYRVHLCIFTPIYHHVLVIIIAVLGYSTSPLSHCVDLANLWFPALMILVDPIGPSKSRAGPLWSQALSFVSDSTASCTITNFPMITFILIHTAKKCEILTLKNFILGRLSPYGLFLGAHVIFRLATIGLDVVLIDDLKISLSQSEFKHLPAHLSKE